ncbi:MAG TPA: ABC transporter permease [Candidatus Binatia bacterium]|jgi:NitT/TauT family transport system permease protein|nr:ABC transporter permease [Candidatus Binatia bacterium]
MKAESATMIADVVERLRPKDSYSIWIWRFLVGAALLLFWQWAAGTLIREAYLAKPTSVMWRLYELFATGTIWVHIRVTLTEVVIGYLMGSFLGLAVGFLLGSSRFLAVVFEPYVMAFYGIPRIALAPIFIIVLGIGIWSKVAVVFIQVFFMLFINAYAGVREINQEYLQLARIMGAKGGLILRKIIIPSTMPFIMLGLRSAVPYAVVGAVVGEFIAASKGLGYFINYAGSTFDSAGAFAGIFILLGFIMAANGLMQWLERTVIKWRRSEGMIVQG